MSGGFTRFILWTTGILGAIGLLLYLLVFDVWTVPQPKDPEFATSILPTLMPEDKILTKRGTRPKYGELARCAHPTSTGSFIVGRVFGEPGDKVEVTDGLIQTNGRGLASSHGCPKVTVVHPATQNLVTMNCGVAETGASTFSFLTLENPPGQTHAATVEAGKLYLVSDNRGMHQDSRDLGLIDAATCEHIVFRLWGEHYTDSSRRFTILW